MAYRGGDTPPYYVGGLEDLRPSKKRSRPLPKGRVGDLWRGLSKFLPVFRDKRDQQVKTMLSPPIAVSAHVFWGVRRRWRRDDSFDRVPTGRRRLEPRAARPELRQDAAGGPPLPYPIRGTKREPNSG